MNEKGEFEPVHGTLDLGDEDFGSLTDWLDPDKTDRFEAFDTFDQPTLGIYLQVCASVSSRQEGTPEFDALLAEKFERSKVEEILTALPSPMAESQETETTLLAKPAANYPPEGAMERIGALLPVMDGALQRVIQINALKEPEPAEASVPSATAGSLFVPAGEQVPVNELFLESPAEIDPNGPPTLRNINSRYILDRAELWRDDTISKSAARVTEHLQAEQWPTTEGLQENEPTTKRPGLFQQVKRGTHFVGTKIAALLHRSAPLKNQPRHRPVVGRLS